MKYALVVTTCGREGVLERTLDAFEARVRPRPEEAVIIDDSANVHYRRWLESVCQERGWALVTHPTRVGFCVTVADGWAYLRDEASSPWAVWLEDDMVVRRPVNLIDLATILAHEPHVAQMALYRNPVSQEERDAGGYINLRPETYARRGSGTMAWFEHRNFWTTNVSLFRRSLTKIEWPEGAECEGRFAFNLREVYDPDVSFGIWGTGEPWVTHIGERAGVGY